ncbi:hypothetical protein SAMN04488595_109179 [Ralstonia sp. 25mfcol4.1]|uniref:hypothetical protein n=1 Tax=Ralstonia sp. 25mfcol4.1 TaxID=1761899 RepID=UPI00088C86AA|nr:hypothetical protein [Ralstonia sp. 25mfcol4.1]SDP45731.1 hypothetical protein SAMN04488595_109179 [Ralstonia sp. 25mfcol4.1]
MRCAACLALSGKPAICAPHAALRRDYRAELALADLAGDTVVDLPWMFRCNNCGEGLCIDDATDSWELIR